MWIPWKLFNKIVENLNFDSFGDPKWPKNVGLWALSFTHLQNYHQWAYKSHFKWIQWQLFQKIDEMLYIYLFWLYGWPSTRQIWGIWKLRPAYSPETPNLGQNRWCFVPCDLEIWWMTLENNRASLLCCFKLCATFHSHRWIQTGVTVRKRAIWVKFDDS